MKLFVLKDGAGASGGSARPVLDAALARGHTAATRLQEADAVYVRTRTFDPWRTAGLELLADAHRRGVPSLPTFAESKLYDDKVAQAAPDAIGPWLPPTLVIRDPEEARRVLARAVFPFISKSAVGAGSQNVRLIRTAAEAAMEIDAVFGAGLPIAKGTSRSPKPISRQVGYLLWQEFIAGNDGDVRVVVNGDVAYGLRRFNRPDKPFASGSGRREVIRSLGEWDVKRAFVLADSISMARGFRWACYDFVFTASRTFCLEVSFSWVESAYDDCPLFRRGSWQHTGETAKVWTRLAVEELERLTRS